MPSTMWRHGHVSDGGTLPSTFEFLNLLTEWFVMSATSRAYERRAERTFIDGVRAEICSACIALTHCDLLKNLTRRSRHIRCVYPAGSGLPHHEHLWHVSNHIQSQKALHITLSSKTVWLTYWPCVRALRPLNLLAQTLVQGVA
jgi:hypothetical protein